MTASFVEPEAYVFGVIPAPVRAATGLERAVLELRRRRLAIQHVLGSAQRNSRESSHDTSEETLHVFNRFVAI